MDTADCSFKAADKLLKKMIPAYDSGDLRMVYELYSLHENIAHGDCEGLTLDELAFVLEFFEPAIKVEKIRLDGEWSDQYRDFFRSRENSFLIVNYFERDISDDPTDFDGHFELLQEMGNVNLLRLYNSMRSVDKVSGLSRGYIKVTYGEKKT